LDRIEFSDTYVIYSNLRSLIGTYLHVD